MKKTAVILAGGKGTRLKPYTIALPKPLVPLGDVPILEFILRQLKYEGFEQIYIAVNHQAELIEAYCGNGNKYGLEIKYFFEERPLGTIGPLKRMERVLPDDFLVMNGDILSDLSYAAFLMEHQRTKACFTIACYRRVQKVDYGVLEISGSRLTGFHEKPEFDYDVSMGVYAVNIRVLEMIPENSYYGFDDLMYQLMDDKAEVRTYKHTGYWMDIGRPEDYEQASFDVENGVVSIMEDGHG